MGFKKDKRAILSLLNNHKQLIFKQVMYSIPSNYAQLQQAAILRELDDEIEKLLIVFSDREATPESLKNSFQKLCDQRDKENQSTCLSYTALPEGVCNRLYIDIATILFKPTQLDEMIHLLMPSVNELLTVEISDFLLPKTASAKLEERGEMILQNKPVNVLSSYQFNSSLLSQIVTNNNVIFMLKQMEKFPLGLHHKFYKLLNSSYPALAAKLYKHNDDLKQLFFDIELIDKNAKTPYEVLTHFANELIRSGSRYTGSHYAAGPAVQACMQFRSYLDQLPQHFREEVLALEINAQKTSLLSILDDLAKGNCVETAAGQIKLLQDNQHNLDVLKKIPNTTEEQLSLVRRKYRKQLSITGFEDTKVLPVSLRQKVLKHIKISSTNDYIDLFLNLPPSEYHAFLSDAQITCYPALPETLGSALEMLDEGQQLAFFKAIIHQRQKFGGIEALLKFCINIKMTAALETTLKLIPSDKIAKIIRRNSLYGHAFLHEAARVGNLDILQIFLKGLSDEDKLNALQERNRNGRTPIQYAVQNNNPEIFRTLWHSLSKKDQSIAAKAKAYNGSKLLHFAAQKSNPEVWQIVWNFHSKHEQGIAINEKNEENSSLLDWALENPDLEVLRSILESLSDKERLAAVLANDRNGNIFLHNAIQYNSKAFLIIWELLTEENRQIAAKVKNSIGSSMLQYAAQKSQPEIWQLVWSYFEPERLIALNEKNTKFNYPLLYWASMNTNPHALNSILEFLPENNRLAALLEKSKDGLSPLFWVVKNSNKAVFDSIWNYLSKSERLKAIQEKHEDISLLEFALDCCPGILDILLQEMPEQDRIVAARQKHTSRGTWLNKAAQYIDYKAAITMWKSLTEQDQLDLIQVINNEGNPLFHINLLHHNRECFCKFWESLSEQNRLVAINAKNNEDNNLLHYAIKMSSRLVNEEEIFLILWNCLSEQKQSTMLQEKNKNNETLLFIAAKYQPKIFNFLWNNLTHENQLIELLRKNNDGNTLLHYAILNNQEETFFSLWKSLSEEEKLIALEEKNNNNETLLYLSRNKPKIFNFIWKDLSEQSRVAEIHRKDKDNRTILHYVVINSEIFYLLWKFLSEQDRLALQKNVDEDGMTLLHWALKNSDTGIFFTLWQNIAPEDRLSAVQEKTNSGKTLLHLAVVNNSDPEIFQAILQDLSELERLTAIRQKDNNGRTPVHLTAINNKQNCLFSMLEFLSVRDKFLVLQEKFDGDTFLHHTCSSLTMARALLCLSQEDRLTVVLEQSKEGNNLIQRAIQQNSETFYLIWKSLSKQARSIVKNSKALNGSSLLQFAAQKSTSDVWQTVWNAYTDQEKRVLIKEKTDPSHFTLLHWALQNPDPNSLNSILEFLSQDLCASLLEVDINGNTPLHLILKKSQPKSLRSIFNFLSLPERLTILKAKDQFGNTFVHHAAKYHDPEVMRIILESLPAQDCLTLFIERDEFGDTALHLAVQNSNPKIWFTMMEYLLEKDRLNTAAEMSACGYTPLQKASENSNPEILISILNSYPESEREEAIKMVEAWWRINCLEGNHWDVLNEEKEKIQGTEKLPSSTTNDLSQRPLLPILAKVSKMGIFSRSKLSEPNENSLTPLQASLLENFVGFKN